MKAAAHSLFSSKVQDLGPQRRDDDASAINRGDAVTTVCEVTKSTLQALGTSSAARHVTASGVARAICGACPR
jgi:hypothetical protein